MIMGGLMTPSGDMKTGRHKHRQDRMQGTDFAEIVGRIKGKRQEVIRPVLENPRAYVLLSVRGLAQRLNRDPATTLRIVQDMGFASYRDFQLYLHNLSIADATPLQLMEATTARDSGIRGVIQESFERDHKNLEALRHSLDLKGLMRVVKRIYSARRIFVIGGDLAEGLVVFLRYNLLIIGLPALSCTSPGEIVHAVRSVGKKDLVLAISYGRGLRQTVEGLKQAHAKGAFCVGVTDTFVSPIVKFADQSFLTAVESPAYSGSYVSPMAFLNVLLLACANCRRSRTITILKQAEQEQRTGFRWYREE